LRVLSTQRLSGLEMLCPVVPSKTDFELFGITDDVNNNELSRKPMRSVPVGILISVPLRSGNLFTKSPHRHTTTLLSADLTAFFRGGTFDIDVRKRRDNMNRVGYILTMLLDPDIHNQARLSRDGRFDGHFFIGVGPPASTVAPSVLPRRPGRETFSIFPPPPRRSRPGCMRAIPLVHGFSKRSEHD